jgi:hypothetical protein
MYLPIISTHGCHCFRLRFAVTLLAITVCLLVPTRGQAGEPTRAWTGLDGRRLDAVLVDADADTVLLRVPTGEEYRLELALLSEADTRYIARWRKSGANAIWPSEAKAKASDAIVIVREDTAKREFVYRSEHFQFASDIRISKSVVLEFSRIFEATYAALSALPLGHRLQPPKGETHFRTRVFQTREEYYRGGGFPGSAGLYVGETGEVLIPLSSLGVRVVGRRVVLNREIGNATLVHELVHQLAALDQKNVPVWYREGIADYLASCPYRTGRFSFDAPARAVVDFLRRPDGLLLPPLRDFLGFGREEFYGANEGLGEEARTHYAGALLLVTHFFHSDGSGDAARIKAYVKALAAGRPQNVALALLIDGRTPEDLEFEMQTAWQTVGLRVAFGTSAGAEKIRP